ncbi:hypothetical protein EMPS_05667 [Entomortierella parvispora]|uniref:DUF1772-domain-containing protein n=1 Tax=Entomortierella parvispora TaxID=205924 RepID=A0A9P3HAW2_9FUNG|nr:hypothetical protein EMPS_05667 [Entomortierella parvispora]
MVNYQFQAFANSNNTLLVGKMIAVTSLGLYAGTALTFNTVIMPSLRKFSSSSSLAIWHESFQVSKVQQLSLTAVGVATNAGLFHKTKNPFYLYSAVALALTFPLSILGLRPISNKLIAIREANTVQGKANSLKDSESDDSVVDRLLSRWNLVHGARTALSVGALLSALYAIIADDSVHFILFK